MSDRYALLLSSLILGVLVILAVLVIGMRKPAPLPESASQVPVFTRAEFSHTDLKGQVHVVNFFASWCPPCEAEHDLLMDMKANHSISIYGINYKDSDSGRRDFLARLGNPYVAVTADQDGTLGETWNINGVPQTFIIDQDGIIRFRHPAPLTRAVLDETIIPMIRHLQAAP